MGGKPTITNVLYDDYSASNGKKDAINLQLPASDDHSLDDAKENATKFQVGHYYRPRASNSATVDSVFLIHPPGESPILLVFRVTRNKDSHDVNLRGLEIIKKLVPPGVRTYYVVITPTNITPRITIPKSYFQDQGLQNLSPEKLSQVFPVFHYPVDEVALCRVE